MSSVNPYFTFKYSQPAEYRFSHDSVFLARRVFELESACLKASTTVLDLCAGCGIVGLDFLFHVRKELGFEIEKCDFLEVQDIYREHFAINLQSAQLKSKHEFVEGNYAHLHIDRSYELILCNPPYFRTGHGKLSPSLFKNRCRFYIDSDLDKLIQFIGVHLAVDGKAYVLLRDQLDHGMDLRAELNTCLQTKGLEYRELADIRGTRFLMIHHVKC